jgi:hypothetical protein
VVKVEGDGPKIFDCFGRERKVPPKKLVLDGLYLRSQMNSAKAQSDYTTIISVASTFIYCLPMTMQDVCMWLRWKEMVPTFLISGSNLKHEKTRATMPTREIK